MTAQQPLRLKFLKFFKPLLQRRLAREHITQRGIALEQMSQCSRLLASAVTVALDFYAKDFHLI
jgi:hypothetical protein